MFDRGAGEGECGRGAVVQATAQAIAAVAAVAAGPAEGHVVVDGAGDHVVVEPREL